MKKGSSAIYRSGRHGRPQRRNCQSRSHNYEDTHYIFLQQSDDSDQDDGRGIRLQNVKEEYLEKELEPGDTLQTLSIQFNCPIAELKRINHIHRDNEVFAHRKIKVPAKYYSLLSEKLVAVHKPSNLNNKDGSSTKSSFSESSLTKTPQSLAVSDVLLNETHSTSVCSSLLNDDAYSNSTLSRHNCDNCETPLIVDGHKSQRNQNNDEIFQCNGSDWGLSWPQLLICTLLLGFAGPLVYIFYLKEAMEAKSDSHGSNNTST